MENEKAKTSPERRAALADIHRMKNIVGLDKDGWVDFLGSAFGVGSAKDLTDSQLQELRGRLRRITAPIDAPTRRAAADSQLADWRRKAYGVIGEWLRLSGWRSDSEAIRTVACRAARRDGFEDIPLSQLKQIYHSWRKKRDTAAESERLKLMLGSTSLN